MHNGIFSHSPDMETRELAKDTDITYEQTSVCFEYRLVTAFFRLIVVYYVSIAVKMTLKSQRSYNIQFNIQIKQ